MYFYQETSDMIHQPSDIHSINTPNNFQSLEQTPFKNKNNVAL